jgi:hypothetical protein
MAISQVIVERIKNRMDPEDAPHVYAGYRYCPPRASHGTHPAACLAWHTSRRVPRMAHIPPRASHGTHPAACLAWHTSLQGAGIPA